MEVVDGASGVGIMIKRRGGVSVKVAFDSGGGIGGFPVAGS